MKEVLAADRERNAWRRVTRARWQAIFSTIGIVVVLLLSTDGMPKHSVLRRVLVLLAALVMVAIFGLLMRVRCPRCGGRFHMRGSRPRGDGGCGQCGAKPPGVTSSPS